MKEIPGEYRIAPHNERKESTEQLDAMIVIPAMDEGDGIFDTILTAIDQHKNTSVKMRYGITVVINNRPHSPKSVQMSNFRTYLLLQALEHGFPLSFRGDADLNEKVKCIQESSVPIHIIDSFSSGFSSPHSNVGRARRIGTEHAISHVKETGFVVSTDADTKLGEKLISTAHAMFAAEQDVVAARFEIYSNFDRITTDEKRAATASNLRWDLVGLVDDPTINLEKRLVELAGGGSAFRASHYKVLSARGGGYKDIPGHEDTLLGAAFAEAGWIVRDMSETYKDMFVDTRQRFSERASIGFGRQTLEFAESDTQFKDILIDSPNYLEQKNIFLQKIESIYFDQLIPKYQTQSESLIDDLYHVFSNSTITNEFVNTFIADTKDEAVTLLMQLCADMLIPDPEAAQLCTIFKRWQLNRENGVEHRNFIELTNAIFERLYPKVPIEQFYSKVRQQMIDINEQHESYNEMNTLQSKHGIAWRFVDYEKHIIEILTKCHVDLSDQSTLLKSKISILASYATFYNSIHQIINSANITNKLNNSNGLDDPYNKKISKIFKLLYMPMDKLYLLAHFSLLKSYIQTFQKIQENLVWSNTPHINNNIINEISRSTITAQSFIKQFFSPEYLDFEEQYSKSYSTAIQLINELDKEERDKRRIEKQSLLNNK